MEGVRKTCEQCGSTNIEEFEWRGEDMTAWCLHCGERVNVQVSALPKASERRLGGLPHD